MKHPNSILINKIINYHRNLSIDEQYTYDFNGIDYIDDDIDDEYYIDYVSDFRETFFIMYLPQRKKYPLLWDEE